MLRFLKKALDFYMAIYGQPGTGVTVYSGADSVTDFYRMRGVRFDDGLPAAKPKKRARKASIWGGNGAAHIVSYPSSGGCKQAGC